jgi:hypothetical protein
MFIHDMQAQVTEYYLHMDQLKNARQEAYRVRDNMRVGEAFVTRDYVNHYDCTGAHVKCLIWVVQWKEQEGEQLRLMKIRNFCSDKNSCSTDAFFTRDVMDFHFKQDVNRGGSGFFQKFHRVYFGGDHGSHFACAATMINESSVYRIYGKEITLLFFPSYHAHGRADGAGAEDKRSAVADLRSHVPRVGAWAYTCMVNSSNDSRSVAYCFDQICRNKGILPTSDKINNHRYLRKWCEVSYEYTNRSKETEGIVKFRSCLYM